MTHAQKRNVQARMLTFAVRLGISIDEFLEMSLYEVRRRMAQKAGN